MLMNSIGKNCSNQLGNSGQQQIGVKCLGILSFTVGKTETVFEMIDVLFNDAPDFIDPNPFECPTKGSGVGSEIFFRVDVKHPTTGRRSTGIFTEALTFVFPGFQFDPFCFGTGEFKPNRPFFRLGRPSDFMGREGSFGQQGIPSA
jgi:hypothetical protein